ncbi:hypothetical protein C8T65DRAFT_228900 [Cerioporus squamosus]|nr:hypothetical protein C8T65DRAFT_228900 [Cerioporus squamosus]
MSDGGQEDRGGRESVAGANSPGSRILRVKRGKLPPASILSSAILTPSVCAPCLVALRCALALPL